MSSDNTYLKTINILNHLKSNSNQNVKYFFFEDSIKCIIEGSKLKTLPPDYEKYSNNDEFWIHIDIEHKVVMYYSYSIEDYISGSKIDESEGFFEWEKIEKPFFQFLLQNLKELSTSSTPFLDIGFGSSDNQSSASSASGSSSVGKPSSSQEKPKENTNTQYPAYSNYGSSYSSGSSYSYSYNSEKYKEREAFFDDVYASLDKHRTSEAINKINLKFKSMRDDKRFDDIDTFISMIRFEKLNLPAMIGILNNTKPVKSELRRRDDFVKKVQTSLLKMKPTLSKSISEKL